MVPGTTTKDENVLELGKLLKDRGGEPRKSTPWWP